MMEKLETNASRYEDWCKEVGRDGNFVGPWRTAKVAWDGGKNDGAAGTVSKMIHEASTSSGIDELEGSARKEEGEEGDENNQQDQDENKKEKIQKEEEEEEDGSPLTPTPTPVIANGLLLPEGESRRAEAARPATLNTEELNKLTLQLEEYKKKVRGLEQAQLLSGEGASLAPGGPANKDTDPDSIQQFRAMVEDALNFLDRQYIHQGKAPSTILEYLTRLQVVVDGIRRSLTISADEN